MGLHDLWFLKDGAAMQARAIMSARVKITVIMVMVLTPWLLLTL